MGILLCGCTSEEKSEGSHATYVRTYIYTKANIYCCIKRNSRSSYLLKACKGLVDVQGHVKPSDVDICIAFVAVQGNIEVPLSFHSSCGFSGTWKCKPFILSSKVL